MRKKSHATAVVPIVAVCCVCSRVPDEDAPTPETWTFLQDYLDRYHLSETDVRLSHTYCPSCYHAQADAWHIVQPASTRPAAA
jgi:hypothetical protein